MIKIKLEEGAKIPKRSTEQAAGWDLFAHLKRDITVWPGQTLSIPTGVSVQLPKGTYWDVRIRSGLSTKHGIMLLNGCGVVDEDYRGIVHIPVINAGKEIYTFNPGDKIGQALLMRYEEQEFELVDKLEDTRRGIGGFGSTGKA